MEALKRLVDNQIIMMLLGLKSASLYWAMKFEPVHQAPESKIDELY